MTDTNENTGEKQYSVYEHVFPNGKRYIGISSDPECRWANGNGYKHQQKMWNAIQRYGWGNIEHNIIVEGLTRDQASSIERKLIAAYDAVENGYNTTIGGDEILETYLNPHILQMIRDSKELDKKYGEVQCKDDIVSLAEGAKFNEKLAKIFNAADSTVQNRFNEYKRYSGQMTFHNTAEVRVDCYWWTMEKLITGAIEKVAKSHTPYWDEWERSFGL